MKVEWTVKMIDVVFIVMFVTVAYFAMKYDIASHNRAMRKCELIYNQTFNTSYSFNFTVNNTTTPIWKYPLGIDTWQPY